MERTLATGKTARRRRSQAEAETEILDAAERFLESHSWHDLTVGAVMALTTMTRVAFYHYFEDRQALFLRLIQRAGDELSEMTERWLTGESTLYEDALATLTGVADTYRRRGRLIRATTEAAAENQEIGRLRETIFSGFVEATERWIGARLRAGDMPPLDPDISASDVAEALCAMGDAYLLRRYGWGADQASTASVANTLLQVWSGALYQLTPQQLRDSLR